MRSALLLAILLVAGPALADQTEPPPMADKATTPARVSRTCHTAHAVCYVDPGPIGAPCSCGTEEGKRMPSIGKANPPLPPGTIRKPDSGPSSP